MSTASNQNRTWHSTEAGHRRPFWATSLNFLTVGRRGDLRGGVRVVGKFWEAPESKFIN